MKKGRIYSVAMLVLFSSNLAAAEWSGPRTIKSLGCHKGDGTCYVELDGAPLTGGGGCTSNQIRWNAVSDTNGKNWFALFAIAKSTNKKIFLQIDGCYQDAIWPTFVYGHIES